MKTGNAEPRVCPICGNTYTDRPAISREDLVTPICPDCGTRQALMSIGVSKEEQDKIIATIHGFKGNNEQ